MFVDVKLFKDTPFFLCSMMDRSSVQQVLPLPFCDPLVIPTTQT